MAMTVRNLIISDELQTTASRSAASVTSIAKLIFRWSIIDIEPTHNNNFKDLIQLHDKNKQI